ncbi:hypothetical protein SDRG_01143 [Saprolegnia diclina VS20]|uniref:Uncharacterized protein n=1 Tax=Saprolegnia diclina (strain VS20) TaxID=1156394 RepID=T0R2H6_SAPDV|nr:hypothetical protein SDRG_01143 [Saprolegnia diclina VS20]EQC41166.1 hypothetical protein SDRG_01143 [Saprolegnia diclina VS20]|eukprot:XP_008604880.1 hypothetical protein SDRG_01143 [Saprolegnia diclina VS20]
MLDDLLKLIKNSPRWAQSRLARRLGFAVDEPAEEDPEPETTDHESLWTKLRVSGAQPPVRSGHASVVVNGMMYVFGGYNDGNCHFDLYAFDLTHHHWTKLENKGVVSPDGRASHAWCASADETKLYLFGGSGPHWGQTNMGKLLQFTLATQKWSVVTTAGTHPPPGYGQSMVAIGSKLYLFGGTSGHVYVNDLFIFDQVTATWSCAAATGTKPSPRYKHQAVVSGNDMYIIGGGLYDPPKGPIDMYKFDALSSHWTKVECVGDLPRSRIAHSVVLHTTSSGKATFLMFGGRDETGTRLNELSSLDLATSTWVRLSEDAKAPDARDFHTGVMWESAMYVFGGSNGIERNSDVHRLALAFEPSTLLVLAVQAVQSQLRSNKALQMQYRESYLPLELRTAVQSLNPDVTIASNDQWFPLPDANRAKQKVHPHAFCS